MSSSQFIVVDSVESFLVVDMSSADTLDIVLAAFELVEQRAEFLVFGQKAETVVFVLELAIDKKLVLMYYEIEEVLALAFAVDIVDIMLVVDTAAVVAVFAVVVLETP